MTDVIYFSKVCDLEDYYMQVELEDGYHRADNKIVYECVKLFSKLDIPLRFRLGKEKVILGVGKPLWFRELKRIASHYIPKCKGWR